MLLQKSFFNIKKAFKFQAFLEKEGFKATRKELKGRDGKPYMWIIEGKSGKFKE